MFLFSVLAERSEQENEEFQLLLEGLNGPSFQDLESKVEWSGKLIANYCIANKLKTSFGKGSDFVLFIFFFASQIWVTREIDKEMIWALDLCPCCPFTGYKMFCAGPKIWLHLVPLQKLLCRHKNQFYWMQIIFLSDTKCLWLPQYVNRFLVWHKKFGPAQHILGPVKGQGIRNIFYVPIRHTCESNGKFSKLIPHCTLALKISE